MSRHRNSEATDSLSYLQLIPRSDDPLQLLNRKSSGYYRLLYAVPAIYGIGASSNTLLTHWNDNENLAGLSYGLGAGVAVAIGALANTIRKKRRYNRLLEEAGQIEKVLHEPVDIVVQPGKWNENGKPALRWYGLDGQHSITGAMIQSAEAMASKAEEMDIDTLAVGVSWFEPQDDETKSLEKYGKCIDGPSALATLSGVTKKLKVNDTLVDKEVLVTTPKLLRELMATCRINDIRRIAELLPDDKRLQELLITAEATQDYMPLRRYVQLRLEQELSEDVFLYAERDEQGITLRSKAFSQMRVRGTSVSSLVFRHDGENEQVLLGETSTLLRECGVNSKEELLSEGDAAGRKRIFTALHIALQDNLKESPNFQGVARATDEHESLFSRIRDGRDIPRLRNRYAMGKIATTVALFATVAIVSSPAGKLARETGYIIPSEHMRNLSKAFEAYEKQENLHIGRGEQDREAFIAYLQQHYGDRAVFEKQMSDLYLDVKDMDARYIRWLTEHVLGIPQASANSHAPPSMYTTNSNEMFIGDVNPGDATVYTAKALTKDAEVGGYWVGAVFSEVTMKRGVSLYPFKDGQIELGRASVMGGMPARSGGSFGWPRALAFEAEDIARLAPDYQVEMPYVAPDQSIVLPLKEGTTIVGAQLIDAANSDWEPKHVSIMRSATHGTSTAYFRNEDFIENGISAVEPKLVYFLKNISKNDRLSLRDIDRGLAISVEGRGDYTRLPVREIAEIASATRRALGLDETASTEEIFKAISDKRGYSKTPLKDAKFGGVDVSELTDVQAIESIAVAIASLDSLNCNMATLLGTLATADRDTNYFPAAGFLDNGDGKLTQAESHAFFWSEEKGALDATPYRISEASGASAPAMGDTLPLPLTGGALVAAAIMMVAYRKREELLNASDKIRTNATIKLPGLASALDLLEKTAYADPNAGSSRSTFVANPGQKELRRRYLANIPKGGVSLSEIRDYARRQGNAISWPEQLVLQSLRLNDGALRRLDKRQASKSGK